MTVRDDLVNVFLFLLVMAIVVLPEVSNWWTILPICFLRVSKGDDANSKP